MRCRHVQGLIEKSACDGLSATEQQLLETHLGRCARCREELGRMQIVTVALRSLPPVPPVPSGFRDRLMARARQQTVQPARQRVGLPAWAAWTFEDLPRLAGGLTAVAAGLLVGAVMAHQTWRYSAAPAASGAARVQLGGDLVSEFDFLSDSPRGSFTEAYLRLTGTAREQEI